MEGRSKATLSIKKSLSGDTRGVSEGGLEIPSRKVDPKLPCQHRSISLSREIPGQCPRGGVAPHLSFSHSRSICLSLCFSVFISLYLSLSLRYPESVEVDAMHGERHRVPRLQPQPHPQSTGTLSSVNRNLIPSQPQPHPQSTAILSVNRNLIHSQPQPYPLSTPCVTSVTESPAYQYQR